MTQDQKAFQGASFFADLVLRDLSGNALRISGDEKIIFGIKDFANGTDVITKILTASDEVEGVYPIYLSPEETDILPERYYYDVSVQLGDVLIKVVPKSNFDVLESITKKED